MANTVAAGFRLASQAAGKGRGSHTGVAQLDTAVRISDPAH
jgi:hypothetical protein